MAVLVPLQSFHGVVSLVAQLHGNFMDIGGRAKQDAKAESVSLIHKGIK